MSSTHEHGKLEMFKDMLYLIRLADRIYKAPHLTWMRKCKAVFAFEFGQTIDSTEYLPRYAGFYPDPKGDPKKNIELYLRSLHTWAEHTAAVLEVNLNTLRLELEI